MLSTNSYQVLRNMETGIAMRGCSAGRIYPPSNISFYPGKYPGSKQDIVDQILPEYPGMISKTSEFEVLRNKEAGMALGGSGIGNVTVGKVYPVLLG